MKINRTIVNLIERAKKDGYAVHRRRERWYAFGGGMQAGELKEVYRITWSEETATLIHYGTEILRYDVRQGRVLGWDGWSMSDRDALNTFLWYVGHPDRFCIREGRLVVRA